MPETADLVGAKNLADREAEARTRAHVRQQMDERGIDQAEVCRMTTVDDGLLSRILTSERGIGLGTLLKLCKGLKITPTRMLETDPPLKYWGENDPGRPSDKKPH
jgi:transcriptional regulator with XRE-family HTH domain